MLASRGLHRILLLCCFSIFNYQQSEAKPNLNRTSQEPVIVEVGEKAFISCKADELGNHTILWKFLSPGVKSEDGKIISAGKVRVTADPRFRVFHHEEKKLWILEIDDVTPSDSGIYICEVNSLPKVQMARILSVGEAKNASVSLMDVDHNYTECCIKENVPSACYGFCHFKTLVSQRQPASVIHVCINHLQKITKCLADGRNHMPCCEKQNIPSACTPACVGNFSLTTVAEHFLCMDYAAPVVACIAEGVQTLPPMPTEVTVEPISPTTLLVKWTRDERRAPPTEYFQINVTQLHSFDDTGVKMENPSENSTERPSLFGLQLRFKAKADANEFMITELKPYTMYEITMFAVNNLGSSLPSNAIRTLTLSADDDRQPSRSKEGHPEPTLPDTKQCCVKNGVTMKRCVDVLCDPTRADEAAVTDIMICAPWANITFKCMATGVDHTECCRTRGVSPSCLSFCKGDVQRLDYRHFICLDHMPAYTSCVLSHHGVLPSSPEKFLVANVHHDWAVLKWAPPKNLSHTVINYHVHVRDLSAESTTYKVLDASKSPFLLDGLKPGSEYEVFVAAVNSYGVSKGSPRIIFWTSPLTEEVGETDETAVAYNETMCCMRANMRKQCLPLCSYRVKVTDVLKLTAVCSDTLSTLIRCGAGGRNHVPCCRRRAVGKMCLNLCAGLIDTSPFIVATQCVDDLGKIIQCMEEGTGLLPGMPIDFHATLVTKNSVHLSWRPAPEDSEAASIYQVRYGKADSGAPLHPLDHKMSKNSTETKAIIENLQPSTLYSFYVVAANSYGISLPSLVLLVNTSADTNKTISVKSKVGPPHEIEILRQTVDSMTFKWLPPLFVPPDSSISYIVHYKAMNGTEAEIIPGVTERWISVETTYNTMIITNLTYNTQYAITIQSKTDKNETSEFSEIVLVWTDPPIAASVNLPVIIPAGPIVEGSNITVMCVGMGIPIPTVSLYINGFLVRKEERRHVAVTIPFVKRNLTSLTCYAVNGFGRDLRSAQSTMQVLVRFQPIAKPLLPLSTAYEGGPGRLQCFIAGMPRPEIVWFKKQEQGRSLLSKGPNVDIVTVPHYDKRSSWISTLLIRRTSSEDYGDYICYAHNEIGESETEMTLHIDNTKRYRQNATACCAAQQVSEPCMTICEHEIDIEKALRLPACYSEMDKLMACAADGSDHRQCCRMRKVPAVCLRWCEGLRAAAPLCSLSAARDIFTCFREGNVLLPGPPKEIHVKEGTEKNKVVIEWSPPDKNPEMVEWYMVFWKPIGSRELIQNKTNRLTFEVSKLNPDKMYEFIVKSGNHYGLSGFSSPVILPSRGWISQPSTMGSRIAKVFLGVFITIVLILTGAALIIFGYKYGYLPKKPVNTGVSFENPSYLKDGTVQIYDSSRPENRENANPLS